MKSRLIGGDDRLLVLIVDDENADEILHGFSCSVLVLSGFDWNRDLSPWPAEAVFKGPDFAGKADETVGLILREKALQRQWKDIYICGYSMAGLFTLYMSTRCRIFSAAASCSGSLWYDGFTDWLKEHAPETPRVYLSVGDREAHSRNARMRTVITSTEETASILQKEKIIVKYELNPGNHFYQPEARMRKGIAWMLGTDNEQLEKNDKTHD